MRYLLTQYPAPARSLTLWNRAMARLPACSGPRGDVALTREPLGQDETPDARPGAALTAPPKNRRKPAVSKASSVSPRW